jgi:hypothetical protein
VSPVRYELGFYIPEDDILHSHRSENLKSYKKCISQSLGSINQRVTEANDFSAFCPCAVCSDVDSRSCDAGTHKVSSLTFVRNKCVMCIATSHCPSRKAGIDIPCEKHRRVCFITRRHRVLRDYQETIFNECRTGDLVP